MLYHLIAFFAGFFLDSLVGDPHFIPHPVRAIGIFISFLERKLNRPGTKGNLFRGYLTVFLVCFVSTGFVAAFLGVAYRANIFAGMVIETFATSFILAAKSLKTESTKVYKALKTGTIDDARKAVSMIVGRDTENLNSEQVTKAAVETVAENTCDGVIAPLLCLAFCGPTLGIFYKAVNTMDSMIGYKNERYLEYGRAAAKLDDIMNFIPARISALLMILSCTFLGKNYSAENAWKIFKRDRYNHASPNSAQTESVCAGALGLQLAGPASYEGKMENKPYIGDKLREAEPEDIKRANRIMYSAAGMCFLICEAVMLLLYFFGPGL